MKKILLFILIAVLLATGTLIGIFEFKSSERYYEYQVDNCVAVITRVDKEIDGDITIPSTLGGYEVAGIEDYAFSDCSNLKSVTLPDSVMNIDALTFNGCRNLTSINTSSGNNYYSSANGVLFDKSKTKLLCYPSGKKNKSYVVPNSVTNIEARAFLNCGSLESVTIPDSVISIGDGAFENCSSLEKITIPDSVTTIGKTAFHNSGYYNNSNNWEDNVLYNGNHLINANTSISGDCSIKDGTITMAIGAFSACSDLESIIIPDSITSIESLTFYNCTSLKKVIIPNSVTKISDSAFQYCSSLESITIPDSVTSIGQGAFWWCYSLANITIPDSATKIDIASNAFYNTAYYDNRDNWDYKILYIGNHLISADSISGICIVNEGTVTIADGAFSFCNEMDYITIPDSVKRIGNSLYGNSSLESIDVSPGNSNYSSINGVLFNKNKTTLLRYPPGKIKERYIIPDSVTSIGDCAFKDCTFLKRITIPDGVTSIGRRTFYNCANIKNITIPYGVTNIGDEAFFDCDNLTDITIPDSVTNIGEMAFSCCAGLGSISIPDSVTTISYRTFDMCSSLTSITIGSGVTSIDEDAFLNCTSLKTVYYNGSEEDKSKLYIDYGNTQLTDAVWNYNIPSDNAE